MSGAGARSRKQHGDFAPCRKIPAIQEATPLQRSFGRDIFCQSADREGSRTSICQTPNGAVWWFEEQFHDRVDWRRTSMKGFWQGFADGFSEARLSEGLSAAAVVLGGSIAIAVLIMS
jgi:hypothetical protein